MRPQPVLEMLEARVPLTLLIDLADPAGPRSGEILHAEQINELLLACNVASEPVRAVYAARAS